MNDNYPPGFDPRDLDDDETVDVEEDDETDLERDADGEEEIPEGAGNDRDEIEEMDYGSPMINLETVSGEAKALLDNYLSLRLC